MTAVERQGIKILISDRVRELVEAKLPNPLCSKDDHKRDLIGSTFLAQMPHRYRGDRSIFGSYFSYEGAPLD